MSASYSPDEPIAAIATALSPAALGVVRTSGAGSVALAAAAFSRPDALLKAKGNTIVHGWIMAGGGRPATAGVIGGEASAIDEVMVSVFRAPHSFTGEEAVEITCHGGVAVVRAVLRRMIEAGFRQAERGEFTFRAYINGKTDLTRAEAVREIIDSRTALSASHAVLHLTGALSQEIYEIKAQLMDVIAGIEAAVEYPEDEETAGELDVATLKAAHNRLARLERTWRSERLYQDGARVVLCGAPNAGKSSLFNILLKEERAIVSPTAGTTRDWIEAWADFDGLPVRLFDTAGLRASDDSVEAEGVSRAEHLAGEADVVLYVVDSTRGLTAEDEAFLARLSRTSPAPVCITVWNKSDAAGSAPVICGTSKGGVVCTSCVTGAGIDDAAAAVVHSLLDSPSDGARATHSPLRPDGLLTNRGAGAAPTLGSERQHEAVRSAMLSLSHALAASDAHYPIDAVGEDITDALNALELLTGEVRADDVLDSVFSRFCVGK